jgi:hypothetical protein
MSDIKCPTHHCDLVSADSESDKASCAEHGTGPLLKVEQGDQNLPFFVVISGAIEILRPNGR